MIPAAFQGPLLVAAFMAVLIVAAGMPLGLFQPPAVDPKCPDCDEPRTRNHVCQGGGR